jgi:hypothetical protein
MELGYKRCRAEFVRSWGKGGRQPPVVRLLNPTSARTSTPLHADHNLGVEDAAGVGDDAKDAKVPQLVKDVRLGLGEVAPEDRHLTRSGGKTFQCIAVPLAAATQA